jgi:hypothetical protein
MTELVAIAEKTLLARQKLPETFGADAIRPSYDGLGLANIAALAVEWLSPDAPSLCEQPALPPFNPSLLATQALSDAWETWLGQAPINHVVLLIVDALGYDQLQTLMDEGDAPGLAAACASSQSFFMPATSVFPSTTVAALTSAATAYAPAQHGIMSTHTYFREIGSVVNLIGFRPSVAPTSTPYLETQLNPDTLLPVPNLYLRLEKSGVSAEIVNCRQFKGSSISRFTSAGSEAGQDGYIGYITPADGLAQLRDRLLAKSNTSKSFTSLYVPNVDTAAHRYGPLSACYRAEVAALDFSLKRELLAPLAGRSDTVLLLVADHGQRPAYPDKILWLERYPEFTRLLFIPARTGESQCRFLYLRRGAEDAAMDYIQQHFGDRFLAVSKAEAIAQGLFGLPGQPPHDDFCDRIGDLILIPRYDWACFQEEHYPIIAGVHGGLSRAEMLIPFLAYRF